LEQFILAGDKLENYNTYDVLKTDRNSTPYVTTGFRYEMRGQKYGQM